MKNPQRLTLLKRIVPAGFFIGYFLVFAIFNRYLIAYQEQFQLFRFDREYFMDFLSKPGGFTEYLGGFLIQFYLYPVAGAFIITLIGFASFVLTNYIFKKYKISGVIWPYIPALLCFILQNDYMFNIGFILDFLIVLQFFALYISIRKSSIRYLFGFPGWIILYLFTGGFSLIGTLLCLIHEFMVMKDRFRLLPAFVFVLMAFFFPYLASLTIYYIPIKEVWLDPIIFTYRDITQYTLLLFVAYVPLILLLIKVFPEISNKKWIQFNWNWKSIIPAMVILSLVAFIIKKNTFDSRLRLFFNIDYNVQHAGWDEVLKLSSKYKGTNHIMLGYINLALFKAGHLGDRMFHYSQIGIPGLLFSREGDEILLFHGSEIFYHLGDYNEAYRWAFDAMIANGQYSPRLLKQLVLVSLVNAQFSITEKYLNILDQSLFYRRWAKKYRKYVNDPHTLNWDPEIKEKRKLRIYDDFLASSNFYDIGLKQLLKNHPDNRMAFDYYMSSLLLDKDLETFASHINRLKEFGYKEIPVHYEEALLIYMNFVKRNILPPGYGIRKTTVERFRNYAEAYSSYSGDPLVAAQSFDNSFGDTYWFYFHFVNDQEISDDSSHPFN